jgi:hypothetical protein
MGGVSMGSVDRADAHPHAQGQAGTRCGPVTSRGSNSGTFRNRLPSPRSPGSPRTRPDPR